MNIYSISPQFEVDFHLNYKIITIKILHQNMAFMTNNHIDYSSIHNKQKKGIKNGINDASDLTIVKYD
jgi:hypothetical protein